jgi:hypothetical protein
MTAGSVWLASETVASGFGLLLPLAGRVHVVSVPRFSSEGGGEAGEGEIRRCAHLPTKR